MCQTLGHRPALFYLILIRSLYAGINYHYLQFAGKETEAQMEVKYYLPRATKLVTVDLGFDPLAFLIHVTLKHPAQWCIKRRHY